MSGWGPDTYPAPPDGWVCFHCGERFLLQGQAIEHFGLDPDSIPACLLSPEHVRAELRRFRVVEHQLRGVLSRLCGLRELLDGAPPTGTDAEVLEGLCQAAIDALNDSPPPPSAGS